jgi:hypothetical protein
VKKIKNKEAKNEKERAANTIPYSQQANQKQ